MGTENALLAAALTEGPTTIANAASEPHVQDLARLLCKMGAQVDGIGSNVMTVHGRDRLGGAEHDVCPDHIEIASFMALAAATSGELRIRDVVPEDLEGIRRHFRADRPPDDGRGRRPARPAGAEAHHPRRPGRRDPEDRRRPLARLPGGPDLDRPGPRHPGGRDDPDPREDVREPAVLRRQAGGDGRSDPPQRPPQGGRQWSEPSSRRPAGEPRHPRRAWRCSSRRSRPTAPRRSATSRRSTAATSGSTLRLRDLGARIERVASERVPA